MLHACQLWRSAPRGGRVNRPEAAEEGCAVGKQDRDKGKGPKKDKATCASCRNFDPKKKGGYCKRRDKSRSADDKVCGSYDPR